MANLINIGGGAGGSSGGGHTILDNGGTSLTQRAELQFKGAYSEDNSTDEVTEVNVVRSMTKAEFDLLTNDEKVGIINVTDESGSADRNYSETTLWSGSETPTTSGMQITLSDNISNYDEIVFVMDTDYVGTCSFLVSQLTIGEMYIATIYAPEYYGAFWVYTSDTSINIRSQSSTHLKTYTKVVGIKYGNGTQTFHNYSTAEQVVGTWIDGSTVYEKTIVYTGVIPYNRDNVVDLSSLEIDKVVSLDVVMRLNEDGDAVYRRYSQGLYFAFDYNESTKYLEAIQRVTSSTSGKNFTSIITIRYTKTNA